MKTLHIHISNIKVSYLLEDLEVLKLTNLPNNSAVSDQNLSSSYSANTRVANYIGTMEKQSLKEIEEQLRELRNEWV